MISYNSYFGGIWLSSLSFSPNYVKWQTTREIIQIDLLFILNNERKYKLVKN